MGRAGPRVPAAACPQLAPSASSRRGGGFQGRAFLMRFSRVKKCRPSSQLSGVREKCAGSAQPSRCSYHLQWQILLFPVMLILVPSNRFWFFYFKRHQLSVTSLANSPCKAGSAIPAPQPGSTVLGRSLSVRSTAADAVVAPTQAKKSAAPCSPWPDKRL